jgi:hypothetical protein
VPSVVESELLSEFSQLQAHPGRHRDPVDVALLQVDPVAALLLPFLLLADSRDPELLLAGKEDGGARERIERRLEPELELAY